VTNLVLAVPPKWLVPLVMGPWSDSAWAEGARPQRIIDLLPELAELRRLRSEPIPVLNLYFKRKLAHIPAQYVALLQSRYDLSFVDISRYQPGDRTALAIAVSDFYALPEPLQKEIPKPAASADSQETLKTAYEMAFDIDDIVRELRGYIPFDQADIDLGDTYFQANTEHELFINEVGSERWAPESNYASIPNLFFAGDFCKTSIGITTVEAAVMSGLNAARKLWESERRGEPIEIEQPDEYPLSFIKALKLLMIPYAYAAKCWSAANEVAFDLGWARSPARSTLGQLFEAPYFFAVDWWRTLFSMAADTLSAGKRRAP
jgi:hypothetical protein